MFRKEVIEKAVASMKALYAEYARKEVIDSLHVSISKGNSKIGRVMNVSQAPLLTCIGAPCWLYCYDVKAVVQYSNVRIARVKNSVLAIFARDRYFAEIETALNRRRRNKFFRWHVGGEMPDYDYFNRTVDVARRHPDFIFWTYTKKYDFVNKFIAEYGRDAIPENYKIMFSEWDGLKVNNPHGLPVFSCKLKAGNKNHAPEYFEKLWKCPGNCDICKAAGRGCLAGENTYADEH